MARNKVRKRKQRNASSGGGGSMSRFRSGFQGLVGRGNKAKRKKTFWDVLFYLGVILLAALFLYRRQCS